MRGLSFRQLEAFLAVVRHGTVTAAAEAVGLTPPAVTSRIKELEEVVGLPLFDRGPRGLRLNPAGQLVHRMALHVNSAIELGRASLADLQGVISGRLHIGLTSTAKYFAPHLVAGFRARHPGVEVALVVGNRGEIIEALDNLAIDVAITGQLTERPFMETEAFGDHPLIVVAPPAHPLARRGRLSRAEVAAEPFLLRESGSGTRIAFDAFFKGCAMAPSHVSIEAGSNEAIKQGVMAGLGLAFLSAHTVHYELMSRRLAMLDVEGLPLMRRWFVTRRVDKTEMPAVRAFRQFVRAEGRTYLPPALAAAAEPQPTG